MTAEEMKAAESGAQSAPLPLEGVDISPKQDEGVLKVRGGGTGAYRSRPPAELGSPGPSLQRPGGSLSRACGRRPVASPSWTRLRCSAVGGPPHARRGWPRCVGLPMAVLWPPGEPAVRVRPRAPQPLRRPGPGLQRQLRRARCSAEGGAGPHRCTRAAARGPRAACTRAGAGPLPLRPRRRLSLTSPLPDPATPARPPAPSPPAAAGKSLAVLAGGAARSRLPRAVNIS